MRKAIKAILIGGAGLALVFIALVGVGAWQMAQLRSPEIPLLENPAKIAPSAELVAAHLSQAVRFKTISYQDPANADPAPFRAFHRWLEATYPLSFATLEVAFVDELSIMMTWPGRDADADPLVMMAHQDVVPADADGQRWDQPPFAGKVVDGEIWGRGALDNKSALIAMLEAVEALLKAGETPQRSLILAFGHDEETRGEGAQAMAARFLQDGIKPWAILDEGYLILEDFPVTDKPTAFIGIAEKGYLTLEITAAGRAGHSSIPPKKTAVAVLADAIARLDDLDLTLKVDGAVAQMLQSVADDLSPVQKFAVANSEVLGFLIADSFKSSDAPRALLGTTMAPTVLSGSEKENVLPAQASVLVNFRIHPRDSSEALIGMVRDRLADIDVTVEPKGKIFEPVRRSTLQGAFELIGSAAKALYPDIAVSPGLLMGATDSRHYAALDADTYRFSPIRMTQAEYGRLHGANERISADNVARAVTFYAHMIMAPVR